MARYEYGGAFDQLVVTPDAALGGALKAAPGTVLPPLYDKGKWDGTRVIVTDFLIDANNDGNLNDPVTSITVDAQGYAPRFLGPDGLSQLFDVNGHIFDPRNKDAAAVPTADETRQGTVEFATSAETTPMARTDRAVHPTGLGAVMAAHNGDVAAHGDIRTAVDNNTAAMQSKADLSGGVVPNDQIDASDAAVPEKIVKYTVTGAVAVTDGLNDNEAVSRLQMETALADSVSVGADVRYKALSTFPSLTSSSTFTTLSSLGITDGASGQSWLYDVSLTYAGIAASGLSIRIKQNTAAVTNKLTNPEFAVNTLGWGVGANLALGRGTTGTTPPVGGASYGTLTAVTASNGSLTGSDLTPAAPGSVWTGAAYCMTQVGTPRNCRVDLLFMDATGNTAVGTSQGTSTATNGATYTRVTSLNSGTTGAVAPSGTVYVKLRVVVISPAVGDVVRVGALQLEPVAPLPAYGSTGGGGSSALEVDGYWGPGLINTSTANTDYTKVNTLHFPTDASTTGTFGGLGASTNATITGSFVIKVVGTGLTDQLIVPEVAQRVTDAGNPTTLIAGRATFARVV